MQNELVILDGASLRIEDVIRVALDHTPVEVSGSALAAVKRGRECVENILKSGKTVYGINTGFGKLAEVKIAEDQLDELQRNLIRSHAVGTGSPLSEVEARAIMLVRLNTLLQGNSGVRVEVVQLLRDFLNSGAYPVIPRFGSLGASGDLAPSAHLALCLIGEGEVFDPNSKKTSGSLFLKRKGLKPLALKAKEGLAIINGTQVMTGLGALLIHDISLLLKNLDLAGAMTLEALGGSLVPFEARIQKLRPLHGQSHIAARILRLLRDSDYVGTSGRIQDPYSLRCIPQVHGAFYDALQFARKTIEIEINSVTDNPLIFPETNVALSAGNFHGQPVSIALDLLGMVIAEISAISERRIDKLLSGYDPRLPLFLSQDPGLNSGFMVTQYTAAALVAENKILARPASLETPVVSAGQEDHASMGVTAALKANTALLHAQTVIAIEMLCAAQAIDLLARKGKMGQGTSIAYQEIRRKSKMLKKDRTLEPDIQRVTRALQDDDFGKAFDGSIQL